MKCVHGAYTFADFKHHALYIVCNTHVVSHAITRLTVNTLLTVMTLLLLLCA